NAERLSSSNRFPMGGGSVGATHLEKTKRGNSSGRRWLRKNLDGHSVAEVALCTRALASAHHLPKTTPQDVGKVQQRLWPSRKSSHARPNPFPWLRLGYPRRFRAACDAGG